MEEITINEKEILEKIVFVGKRRYYKEDLTKRDYSLENTTPYKLTLLGRVVEEHSWGNLLCKTTGVLLELFPYYEDKLLDFCCSWSKAHMFAKKQKTNFKKVADGVYINCNHTAQHSCWVLQDLLDFFQINKEDVIFLIHRPSSAEPKELAEYLAKKAKQDFVNYLCASHNKTEEYAMKVYNNIEKYLNPMLKTLINSKSYNNFLLFDDYNTMVSYVGKTKQIIMKDLRYDEKIKKIIFKYFEYLLGFYKE